MHSLLREQIAGLLQEQRFMVLCTQSAQGPYCSLVAFAAPKSLEYIFFATRRGTRKFQNLMLEPRVSLLVDDRQNLDQDLQQARALTVIGAAAESAKDSQDAELFLAKQQKMISFLQEVDSVLMRVKVHSYYLVQEFETVQQLDMV